MTYWRLKSCARCHGDVVVERGEYSWMEYCLQCGARRYVPLKAKEQALTENKRELVAAR